MTSPECCITLGQEPFVSHVSLSEKHCVYSVSRSSDATRVCSKGDGVAPLQAKEDLRGLPAWTLLANASRVLHLGFGGAGSILSVNKHTLKAHGLPAAGAALVLTVQRKGPQQFVFAASDAGSGRCCLEGTFHADFLYAAPQAASAPASARCFRAAPTQLPEVGTDWGQAVIGDAFGGEAALNVQASNVVSGGDLMARLERRVGEEAGVLMPSPSIMVPS